MTKLPITLTVITLNEESNIKRCIESAPFVDEIVVVDSYSTDKTVEIAQALGAKVFQQQWLGFGPQKDFAVSQAKNSWIISLDADEALSPDLQTEIVEKFKSLDPQSGYKTPRSSFYLGRWIKYGGWYPDYQLRLFNKEYSNWNTKGLHEKVIAPREQKLSGKILHWVFRDINQHVATNNRYSSLGAKQLVESGKRFSLLKLVFKPISKFIECYFIKLGFLDGLPGFIIAVSAGYSMFLRWAKLWEVERSQN